MNTLRRTKKYQYQHEGYLFILPVLLFFGIFCLYPILFNLYYSQFDWNGMSKNKIFVGLENFRRLFKDPTMFKIIRNQFVFFFGTIFPQAFLGIIIAYIISRKARGGTFFRTLLYMPSVLTVSITGTIFSRMLEANTGEINIALRAMGLNALALQWLGRPYPALFSLVMVNIWTWTGFSMLLYNVNMTHISEELYEAATIDGASGFQQFFRLTFPLLRNTHLSLILLGSISTLKTFDLPYVLTRAGPNHATEFFSTYIYLLSFDYFDQGESSALVTILFFLALALTIIQLRMYGLLGRKEKA
ncbi:MAG: sugar ABC transporter permease [Treponema sp.]|nr:sugar ABC transporter permease [Treponema sp.]